MNRRSRLRALTVAILGSVLVLGPGCRSIRMVNFPSGRDVYVTTGDGDITKPYEPLGMIMCVEKGVRIPLPLLGLIPLADVDPDITLKQKVIPQVKTMGGDAIINLGVNWEPASPGFLGIMASGGYLAIYGTVVRR